MTSPKTGIPDSTRNSSLGRSAGPARVPRLAKTNESSESPEQLVVGFSPRPAISHVVFDFDGTLSWLRHGWPELMAGLFLKHIPKASAGRVPRVLNQPGGAGESKGDVARAGLPPFAAESGAEVEAFATQIHAQLLDDILSLNGKSSIYQMERCAQRVLEHGGPKLEPQRLLEQYLETLAQLVEQRKERIRRGEAAPDEFVVHGARNLLERLRARGLVLVVLSGTAEPQVREETRLLGLAQFFGSHIYGSTADLLGSSKEAVLGRLMRRERVAGGHLLSFGDGPVEIRLTKQAGGLAVGVASDEDRNGSGIMHPQKTAQLREAGADCLIPDYREADRLIQAVLGS